MNTQTAKTGKTIKKVKIYTLDEQSKQIADQKQDDVFTSLDIALEDEAAKIKTIEAQKTVIVTNTPKTAKKEKVVTLDKYGFDTNSILSEGFALLVAGKTMSEVEKLTGQTVYDAMCSMERRDLIKLPRQKNADKSFVIEFTARFHSGVFAPHKAMFKAHKNNN